MRCLEDHLTRVEAEIFCDNVERRRTWDHVPRKLGPLDPGSRVVPFRHYDWLVDRLFQKRSLDGLTFVAAIMREGRERRDQEKTPEKTP